MRLFERRGFDRVTMDEIAEAAGVSRRTLFRLFPSKSDIVWDGVKGFGDALQARATAVTRKHQQLDTLVDELCMPVLQMLDEPALATIARQRLRLMARAPALLMHPALIGIESVIAKTLASGALPGGVPASLAARTLVAAMLAALLWWAEEGGEMRARDAVRGGLKVLERRTPAPRATSRPRATAPKRRTKKRSS